MKESEIINIKPKIKRLTNSTNQGDVQKCISGNQSVANKDERFVSRYIANAIYCINWKYCDIVIIRIYRDILMIFFYD